MAREKYLEIQNVITSFKERMNKIHAALGLDKERYTIEGDSVLLTFPQESTWDTELQVAVRMVQSSLRPDVDSNEIEYLDSLLESKNAAAAIKAINGKKIPKGVFDALSLTVPAIAGRKTAKHLHAVQTTFANQAAALLTQMEQGTASLAVVREAGEKITANLRQLNPADHSWQHQVEYAETYEMTLALLEFWSALRDGHAEDLLPSWASFLGGKAKVVEILEEQITKLITSLKESPYSQDCIFSLDAAQAVLDGAQRELDNQDVNGSELQAFLQNINMQRSVLKKIPKNMVIDRLEGGKLVTAAERLASLTSRCDKLEQCVADRHYENISQQLLMLEKLNQYTQGESTSEKLVFLFDFLKPAEQLVFMLDITSDFLLPGVLDKIHPHLPKDQQAAVEAHPKRSREIVRSYFNNCVMDKIKECVAHELEQKLDRYIEKVEKINRDLEGLRTQGDTISTQELEEQLKRIEEEIDQMRTGDLREANIDGLVYAAGKIINGPQVVISQGDISGQMPVVIAKQNQFKKRYEETNARISGLKKELEQRQLVESFGKPEKLIGRIQETERALLELKKEKQDFEAKEVTRVEASRRRDRIEAIKEEYTTLLEGYTQQTDVVEALTKENRTLLNKTEKLEKFLELIKPEAKLESLKKLAKALEFDIDDQEWDRYMELEERLEEPEQLWFFQRFYSYMTSEHQQLLDFKQALRDRVTSKIDSLTAKELENKEKIDRINTLRTQFKTEISADADLPTGNTTLKRRMKAIINALGEKIAGIETELTSRQEEKENLPGKIKGTEIELEHYNSLLDRFKEIFKEIREIDRLADEAGKDFHKLSELETRMDACVKSLELFKRDAGDLFDNGMHEKMIEHLNDVYAEAKTNFYAADPSADELIKLIDNIQKNLENLEKIMKNINESKGFERFSEVDNLREVGWVCLKLLEDNLAQARERVNSLDSSDDSWAEKVEQLAKIDRDIHVKKGQWEKLDSALEQIKVRIYQESDFCKSNDEAKFESEAAEKIKSLQAKAEGEQPAATSKAATTRLRTPMFASRTQRCPAEGKTTQNPDRESCVSARKVSFRRP